MKNWDWRLMLWMSNRIVRRCDRKIQKLAKRRRIHREASMRFRAVLDQIEMNDGS